MLFHSLTLPATGMTTARLQTTDTLLRFEAGKEKPRLISLQSAGRTVWINRAPEALIGHVEIDGQSRPVDWKFNPKAVRVDADHVEFIYDAETPRLRLHWEWRVRTTHGPIEHRIIIENLTSQEIWLPLQDSFIFDWQIDPQAKLEELYVDKGVGTPPPVGTHQVALPDGYAWEGTSSPYAEDNSLEIIPWFLVKRAGDSPDGWYVGLEFSGCTGLSLARAGESLHGTVGLDPKPGVFRTRVLPGESFVAPTVFLGGFVGDADAAGNILRRWVRDGLTNPLAWTNPNYPLMVNNSWGSGMAVDEALAQRMIRDSAELGLDMFHLDAGWFRGVGDWHPDPKKFPNGLATVADYAHQHGLKFGLWIDWSQAGLDTNPGALNVRDHITNKWLTTEPSADWKPAPFVGITFDVGVPQAEAWVRRELERVVRAYHLDMLEHDGYLVAKGCALSDHPHAPPGDVSKTSSTDVIIVHNSSDTDVSYHAVRAYYEIYSNLRKEHPGLLLEACNNGGRMVDFGSASHCDYLSITDTYDPLSNRRAFYDASHVLPAAMLECYVEKWPVPHMENFRLMLRSGMMGWLTIMLDTTQWTPEQHRVAQEEFHFYKTVLRSFIRDADLYHISQRPDGIRWDGIEYFDSRRKAGVVYAFRGSTETESSHTYNLQGLRAGGIYRLHFHDGSGPDLALSGRALCKSGLSVTLPVPNSSELILINEVAP